jgi:hypothetical protein
MPLISTMSPGPASVTCTRSRPWKVSTWLMRPLYGLAVRTFHHQHVHHGLDRAGVDAAHADAADEAGEVQRGDLQLQRGGRVALLRGTCFSTVSNRADMSGPHCSPGSPSSIELQPLMPEA